MLEGAAESEDPADASTDLVESRPCCPRPLGPVQQHLRVDQTPVADGDLVGGQADLLEVAGVTVGEEDVRSPQELVQLDAIVTGIGQVRRSHAYLCVPEEHLD